MPDTSISDTPGSPKSSIFSFSEAIHLNPQAAKFIAGGLLLFFAVAQITSLFSDTGSAITIAVVLLVFCGAIPLFQHMVKNPKQRAVLSWACILMLVLLMGGYLNSALFRLGNPPEPKCYFRIITAQISRQECESEYATTTTTIGAEDVLWQPGIRPKAAVRIWQAALWRVADYGPEHPYEDGLISLQYSANVARADAIRLSESLEAAGWPIDDGDNGGTEVADAPSDNEVRFFHKNDEEAATALARSLYDLNPGTPVQVKNFSKMGRVTGHGNLEIWLDKIAPAGTEG